MSATSDAIWVGHVELSQPLHDISTGGPDRPYRSARLLVRMHHQPIGFVSVPVCGGGVAAQLVADTVWHELGDQVRAHLLADGIAPPQRLGVEGLHGPGSCAGAGRSAAGDRELISVVVCTRDRPSQLAACLSRLQELRYEPFEVVVVDNAPATNQTEVLFAEQFAADARLRYVREPRPGLSCARNRGVGEARGRIVAFTDDDVLVDPWWLDGIASGFARHPLAGCVTGLVPSAQLDSEAQLYFDQRVSWASSCEGRVYDLGEHRDDSPLYPYGAGVFGTGANFAFDRRLLAQLGGFDEALGAGSPAGGGEDLDIFVATLRSGRSIAYEPSAIVWHVHRADVGQLRRQLFSYGVGLSAFVTKYLVDPSTAPDVLRRAWHGLRRARQLCDTSEAPPGLSGRLVLAEAMGMAWGPIAYVQGRRHARHRASEVWSR